MYLLGLGLVLMLMKWQGISVVADWPWWLVLAPFAAAALWWTIADLSGYTQRQAAAREQRRQRKRLERQREALGASSGRARSPDR